MVSISNSKRARRGQQHPILFFVLCSQVRAMIPPHPASDLAQNKSWVPVDQYRRNMGIDYGYETKLINPELCRNEEEASCQEMDRALQDHAHRTLQLTQNTGTLKVLVILLQFQNHIDRQDDMIDFQDINTLFNSERRDDELVPSGSIRSYMRINSHDNLMVEATVVPWVLISESEQDCVLGNSGLDKAFQKCFWPILDALDQVHGDPSHSFSWDDFDQNRDGFIDSLVVMHSGYGAEWGGTDPDGALAEDRIWSHSSIGARKVDRWQSKAFLIDVGAYCVTSAFRGNQGGNIARIGVIVHEMIHTLGIPDLFDLSLREQGGGAGSYSVMSDAWGQGNDPVFPGHLDPWSKMQLGWIFPTDIESSGTYKMFPSESEPDIYMISKPYPKGEYLLIENRQPLLYDLNLQGGGVLIWHIDDSVFLNTAAGGPYQVGWPGNGAHYQVAVVQADGLYELEQDINKGDAGDFYVKGRSLGSGKDGSVSPNTDAYQGGQVIETSLVITDFVQSGLQMKFTVNGLAEGSPTNAPLALTVRPPKPVVIPTQCVLNVNLERCSQHTHRILPQDDCDCYNVCGNGIGQGCCKFGEPCNVDCKAGGLVAGCLLDDSDSDLSRKTPKSEKEIQEGEFIIIGLDVEEMILKEGTTTDESLRSASAANTFSKGMSLFPFGALLWFSLIIR